MIVPLDTSLIFFTLLSLALTILWFYANRKIPNPRNLPLPPGPTPLPIVGNIFDIPKDFPWLTYQSLSQKYGDVVHLRIMGQSIIIASTSEVAIELLEKRSANYSDRATSAIIPLLGCDWVVGLMPYGHRWRRTRQIIHQYFNRRTVEKYREIQIRETGRFLRDLLTDSDRFTISSSLIMYGFEPQDDKYFFLLEKASESTAEGLVSGTFLVEFIPFLKYIPSWVPGAGFQKKFAEWRAASAGLRDIPFGVAKEAFNAGTASSCIETALLEKISRNGGEYAVEEEEFAKDALATAHEGGADTTFSLIHWFFAAMLAHPEVQKKAQAELDAVIGPRRLPTFSDRDSLSYINAVVLECLRWFPVIPVAPHRATADDEYNGYFIPKGSLVVPNIWALARDASVYAEPEDFNPDRFLKDGKLDPDVADPSTLVFGFGRRSCAGRHLADASLFITAASVLHVYEISPHLDEMGRPAPFRPAMKPGAFLYLVPFKCRIKPRSEKAEKLVLATMDPQENLSVPAL
ncbi:O-methylsterigmatocystin oxidoreductase [Grifola frondosa]|uniref:O-methylsterigmatocystin oxidoreductase n=1 Tax=Grifola frondosa TaxID=5627 RepID=A0A1C7LS42_GRIFR|nr:O-methylsterigmatocystin oxidoreductase [Grifola frondosa]